MVRLLHPNQHDRGYVVLGRPHVQRREVFLAVLRLDFLLALWLGCLWPNPIPSVPIHRLKVCRYRLHSPVLLRRAYQLPDQR